MQTRLTWAIGSIAAVALLVVGVAGPAHASPKRRPVVSLSARRSIRIGSYVTLTGRVSPNEHGHRVKVQRYSGHTWHTVRTARLSRHSHFAAAVRPPTVGVNEYRIHDPKTRQDKAASSRRVVVHVAPKTSVPQMALSAASAYFSPAENNFVIALRGWAIDLDRPGRRVGITVAEGTHHLASATTTVASPTVDRRYRATGTHGFAVTVTSSPGRHDLCVTASNIGPGRDNKVCRSVVAPANRAPLGQLEEVTRVGSSLVATGWTYDPDDPGYSADVHLDSNDPPPDPDTNGGYGDATASEASPDIDAQYGITGKHRFSVTLSAGAEMYTYACATARDLGPGYPLDGHLGCVTTPTEDGQPVGAAYATAGQGVIHLTGYAFDPDDTSSSLTIRVALVGGSATNYVADQSSPDADATYNITGDHGFDVKVPAPAGTNNVVVYIDNVGSGRDVTTYAGTLTVS